LPTTIFVTLRERAKRTVSSAALSPLSMTVSTPICSARRMLSPRRWRSALDIRSDAGVST
jgi:hypothetical protein